MKKTTSTKKVALVFSYFLIFFAGYKVAQLAAGQTDFASISSLVVSLIFGIAAAKESR